jgi:enoyl-CoA hydratase
MSDGVVLYGRRGDIAVVTMNRPGFRNAQNSAMTYALDESFYRAVEDDGVKVIVLAGAGPHFSAGHDIGTPGRDADVSFERRAPLVGPRGQERR